MVNLIRHVGIRKDVALAAIGWLSFVLGLVIPIPALSAIFMVTARTLPKALYQQLPFIDANLLASSCISPVLTWRYRSLW